ncbi:hypothetical protein P12x_005590 [Tundrisphaera lichenicola]|uniref:hypothetical protein n=1 Tax=Tundrisphaera lichenicola TaxID=2029860 RepID=UPI003EC13271
MRFSIGKLMILVAICAIGFSLRYWEFGALVLLGGLPMLVVLAVAALFQAPGRTSIDRFLKAGGVTLVVYLGIAAVAAKPINTLLLTNVNQLIPLGNRSLPILVGRISLGVLLNLAPQLALAGLLAERLRGPRNALVPSASPNTRSSGSPP